MPTAMTCQRSYATRVLALSLSFGLLTAGCTGGSGTTGGDNGSGGSAQGQEEPVTPPPVPQGYTRVSAGNLSLAHPPRWQQVDAPKGWALAMELQTAAGSPMARLGVVTSVPQSENPSTVSAAAFAGVQLGVKVQQRQPDREIKIPGANGAVRVDYTFADSTNGAAGRGVDISIVYGERKAATVRITGLRNALPLELADQIARTIVVKG